MPSRPASEKHLVAVMPHDLDTNLDGSSAQLKEEGNIN